MFHFSAVFANVCFKGCDHTPSVDLALTWERAQQLAAGAIGSGSGSGAAHAAVEFGLRLRAL